MALTQTIAKYSNTIQKRDDTIASLRAAAKESKTEPKTVRDWAGSIGGGGKMHQDSILYFFKTPIGLYFKKIELHCLNVLFIFHYTFWTVIWAH